MCDDEDRLNEFCYNWVKTKRELVHTQACQVCTRERPCFELMNTQLLTEMHLICFAYKVIPYFPEEKILENDPHSLFQNVTYYIGSNPGDVFLEKMRLLMKHIQSRIKDIKPLVWKDMEEKGKHQWARTCNVCQESFFTENNYGKVADHR